MTVCNWCKGQVGRGERTVQDNPDEAPGAVLHETTLDCAESLKERLEAAKLQIHWLTDILWKGLACLDLHGGKDMDLNAKWVVQAHALGKRLEEAEKQ